MARANHEEKMMGVADLNMQTEGVIKKKGKGIKRNKVEA